MTELRARLVELAREKPRFAPAFVPAVVRAVEHALPGMNCTKLEEPPPSSKER
jgi:hypothetical protein